MFYVPTRGTNITMLESLRGRFTLFVVSDKIIIITARKRSLGQGNIFAPVCHSVHWGGLVLGGGCLVLGGGCLVLGGGCLVLGGVPGPGGCLVETPPGTATAEGGTHPTGMHSCSLMRVHKCLKMQEVCEPVSQTGSLTSFQHTMLPSAPWNPRRTGWCRLMI